MVSRLLKGVLQIFATPLSLSKNLFFDRLAEVKGAIKTSNSTPKCIWILERGELRSKSKYLAQQAFGVLVFGTGTPSPTGWFDRNF